MGRFLDYFQYLTSTCKAVITSLYKSLCAQLLSFYSPYLIFTTNEQHSSITIHILYMKKLRSTRVKYPVQDQWLIGSRASVWGPIFLITPCSKSPCNTAPHAKRNGFTWKNDDIYFFTLRMYFSVYLYSLSWLSRLATAPRLSKGKMSILIEFFSLPTNKW